MKKKLEDELKKYSRGGYYGFHMPGHKRKVSLFDDPFGIDISEIDGFDDLHDPQGIILDEMKEAADFYGTKDTLFSVNGSSACLLAAISAAVKKGGTIILGRNCHISVFNAIYLRELQAEYIYPVCKEPELCAGGVIRPEDVRVAIEKTAYGRAVRDNEACKVGAHNEAEQRANSTESDAHTHTGKDEVSLEKYASGNIGEKENACADQKTSVETPIVMLTSPTYDGEVSDIGAIADIVHEYKGVLIVDEAHGAHLGMHDYFPKSAIKLGADIVVQSLHKTLPSLTQTALLHNVTGRVRTSELQRFMDIYESTSPSYVLMASITGCIHFIEDRGKQLFNEYVARLKRLRAELSELLKLKIIETADRSKVLISTKDTNIDGNALYEELIYRYKIQPEAKFPEYVIMITSVADTDEGFSRLAEALREIDGKLEGAAVAADVKEAGDTCSEADKMQEDITYTVAAEETRACCVIENGIPQLKISQALDMPREKVRLDESVGRVCGTYVYMYPPGIPLLLPGEVISLDAVSKIKEAAGKKISIKGAGAFIDVL